LYRPLGGILKRNLEQVFPSS